MSFLLWLWLGCSALAQIAWLEAPENNIPVYAKPQANARVLYYTNEGERLAIRSKHGEFTKVQIRRGGKWRVGYAYSYDLEEGSEERRRSAATSNLGVGAGALYTHLQQGSKSFETEDQVQYQTTNFTSGAMSFGLALQFGRTDFWRLLATYRRTEYKTTATTNVSTAGREVEIEHTMASGGLQRVWNLRWDALYIGAGVEVARALATTVKIAGSDVPTSDQDFPTYVGVQGVLGLQFPLPGSFSLFLEARPLAYVNQSPIVMGTEVAASLLYWP